jgi:hypothetical protein
LSWLETIYRDVRHGCRLLVRRPGFATVAVLTLGVGLGTMTVAFSAVNAFFIALFIGSAWLFRHATRQHPPADAAPEG